ncbi:hypothetical protein KIW84_040944 [Lathyrus oleraceus]|uniref:Uncharacterized protein n=1 Tax=Pisum sativum TaxID=3888 RepID=A0A9D4X8N6_PEA|nr:hypothetical protein KIW84_040944 [Pisum sativum]
MYDRAYPGKRIIKPNFEAGVKGFITWEFAQEYCRSEGGVKYQLLKEMNMPLFEGSSESKSSMCIRLLVAMLNWNIPNQCLEFFANMMLNVTPTKDNMPSSFYDAKRLVNYQNFFDNVFNTVMDVQGKTKDNENARKDMEVVEGHQVGAFILLEENNVDKENDEFGSEDNIRLDDENDMDEEH